jgi:hypothetical protein
MKRRTFFRITLAGVAAIGLGIFGLNFTRVARNILLKDTSDLNFKEHDLVERFMKEAEAERFWKQFSLVKRIFICVQHYFHVVGIPIPYRYKYLQYRSIITGHFLLSTDLFQNYGDVLNKEVTYRGFFNPYKAPCANPFSNLRMPA